MTVTGPDLLKLGLPQGPHFATALAEANRLHLTGAALETFVRALLPETQTAATTAAPAPQALSSTVGG